MIHLTLGSRSVLRRYVRAIMRIVSPTTTERIRLWLKWVFSFLADFPRCRVSQFEVFVLFGAFLRTKQIVSMDYCVWWIVRARERPRNFLHRRSNFEWLKVSNVKWAYMVGYQGLLMLKAWFLYVYTLFISGVKGVVASQTGHYWRRATSVEGCRKNLTVLKYGL